MFRAAATCLVLVGLLFSGCVGSDGKETSATGAIAGLITDDQIQPLAGAEVALLEKPETTTKTDVTGRFTLSNIEPGSFKLAIQMLGYESIARGISVEAGAVTEVQIALNPIE